VRLLVAGRKLAPASVLIVGANSMRKEWEQGRQARLTKLMRLQEPQGLDTSPIKRPGNMIRTEFTRLRLCVELFRCSGATLRAPRSEGFAQRGPYFILVRYGLWPDGRVVRASSASVRKWLGISENVLASDWSFPKIQRSFLRRSSTAGSHRPDSSTLSRKVP